MKLLFENDVLEWEDWGIGEVVILFFRNGYKI